MEQDRRSNLQSDPCEIASSVSALTLDDTRGVAEGCIENTEEVLQATARHFSKVAGSSGVDFLVEKANDAAIHEKLEEVLAGHFHKFGLNSLQSVLVYVLLNYFLAKKENKELESAKRLYEDHIALLKEKNSELSRRPKRESEPEGVPQTLGAQASCKSCEELQQSRDALSAQYARLKKSYDEVCERDGKERGGVCHT